MIRARTPSSFPAAFLAAACLCLHPGIAGAVEETPYAIPGGKYVSTEEAKVLHDAGAGFIDARVGVEYAEQHIKGARNLTFKEEFGKVSRTGPGDRFDLAALPGDKSGPLVFYCNGSPCWKGYKAAEAAIKAGYAKVHWYRDGVPSWAAKGYPTE